MSHHKLCVVTNTIADNGLNVKNPFSMPFFTFNNLSLTLSCSPWRAVMFRRGYMSNTLWPVRCLFAISRSPIIPEVMPVVAWELGFRVLLRMSALGERLKKSKLNYLAQMSFWSDSCLNTLWQLEITVSCSPYNSSITWGAYLASTVVLSRFSNLSVVTQDT